MEITFPDLGWSEPAHATKGSVQALLRCYPPRLHSASAEGIRGLLSRPCCFGVGTASGAWP